MVITCGNLVYRLEPKNEFEVHCRIHFIIKMVITCGNLVYRLEPKNEFKVHCYIALTAHFILFTYDLTFTRSRNKVIKWRICKVLNIKMHYG